MVKFLWLDTSVGILVGSRCIIIMNNAGLVLHYVLFIKILVVDKNLAGLESMVHPTTTVPIATKVHDIVSTDFCRLLVKGNKERAKFLFSHLT